MNKGTDAGNGLRGSPQFSLARKERAGSDGGPGGKVSVASDVSRRRWHRVSAGGQALCWLLLASHVTALWSENVLHTISSLLNVLRLF